MKLEEMNKTKDKCKDCGNDFAPYEISDDDIEEKYYLCSNCYSIRSEKQEETEEPRYLFDYETGEISIVGGGANYERVMSLANVCKSIKEILPEIDKFDNVDTDNPVMLSVNNYRLAIGTEHITNIYLEKEIAKKVFQSLLELLHNELKKEIN